MFSSSSTKGNFGHEALVFLVARIEESPNGVRRRAGGHSALIGFPAQILPCRWWRYADEDSAAASIVRAISTSSAVTPAASWVVSTTSTRL